jgi:hypothetical protein
MRAAPVVFTVADTLSYAHLDYVRLIKARGAVVAVNAFDDDEDESARQKLVLPAGNIVLGLGANASATPAAALLLAELGVRVLSTVGKRSSFEPFDDDVLARAQAIKWSDAAGRLDLARHLYAAQFSDSPLVVGAPVERLAGLAVIMHDETLERYTKRFKPPRFKRQAGKTDPTNVTLDLVDELLVDTASDVCRLLGLSTALGAVRDSGRLAFAEDLADAFRLDVTIPVGFIVGAQKLSDPADVVAAVSENLHHHRIVVRMIELAQAAFAE